MATDMPALPLLRNCREGAAPLQKYMVLAYTMSWEEIATWVANHNIPTNGHWANIIDDGLMYIQTLIPRRCSFGTVRVAGDDSEEPAWILASNKSEEHLRRAQDLVTIEHVRNVIGTAGPPQWYRPGR